MEQGIIEIVHIRYRYGLQIGRLIMRKIVILIVIALLAISSFACSKNQQGSSTKKKPEIEKVKVGRETIKLSVESNGRIVSNLDVDIKCKASGEIITLPYDISDRVSKGALVVELDPTEEQRNVSKAQISLNASEARLEKARQNLKISTSSLGNTRKSAEIDLESARIKAEDARAKANRIKQLLEKKLSSPEESESAETAAANAEAAYENAKIKMKEIKTEEDKLELDRQDLKLAQTEIDSAKISLTLAEQRLSDTKIVSPIDGVITSRPVQIGQIISSGISNVGGGTSVMTISDLSRLFVLASVDESDIGNVQVGQDVSITVDAFPKRAFKGKINRIAQKGASVSNVVTFEVRIEIIDKEIALLKPEMTADVEILVAQKDNVIAVPSSAVMRKGDKQVVKVETGEGPVEREVTTGINNGEKIEITSGLAEGEVVLVQEGSAESQWRNSQENRPRPPMLGGFGR